MPTKKIGEKIVYPKGSRLYGECENNVITLTQDEIGYVDKHGKIICKSRDIFTGDTPDGYDYEGIADCILHNLDFCIKGTKKVRAEAKEILSEVLCRFI